MTLNKNFIIHFQSFVFFKLISMHRVFFRSKDRNFFPLFIQFVFFIYIFLFYSFLKNQMSNLSLKIYSFTFHIGRYLFRFAIYVSRENNVCNRSRLTFGKVLSIKSLYRFSNFETISFGSKGLKK